MKENRPVNLDLTTISMPITAITSILHRISGVAIFVGLAVLLYLFDASLASPESFSNIKAILNQNLLVKLLVWLVFSGIIYHVVAGVKHLIMDLGIGETLEGGKKGAMATVAISVVLIILAGVWIW